MFWFLVLGSWFLVLGYLFGIWNLESIIPGLHYIL